MTNTKSSAGQTPHILADHLEAILANIGAIDGFLSGLSREEFLADTRTVYATVQALACISDASRHVPDSLLSRHPEIPWRTVRNASGIYRRYYASIAPERVWETATGQLAALEAVARAERAALPE